MASLTTDAVTTNGTFSTEVGTSAFQLGAARSLAIGATSDSIALTSTCRYVSLIAAGGNHCHFTIGVGAQTATSSSHYLKTGERLILSVLPGSTVAVIQGTGGSTTLYITELTD